VDRRPKQNHRRRQAWAHIRGPRPASPRNLNAEDVRLNRTYCRSNDLILQFKNVIDHAVKVSGPNVGMILSLDQLTGNADPSAGPTQRSLEQISDAEAAPGFTSVDCLSLQRVGGGACDNEEPVDASERCREILDHTIGERGIFATASEILERQHRE
jgi:hypothetical protein